MSGADGWFQVRPVVEMDATGDKCFFDFEPGGGRMCGHGAGDPVCLRTRHEAGDDEASRVAQLALFGEAFPCPDCGAHAACCCLGVEVGTDG